MLLAERIPWPFLRMGQAQDLHKGDSGSMDGDGINATGCQVWFSSFRKDILLDVYWEVSYLSLILHSLSKVLALKWDKYTFSLKKW